MFMRNGASGAESTDVMFRRVRQVAAPGAKLLADASYKAYKHIKSQIQLYARQYVCNTSH